MYQFCSVFSSACFSNISFSICLHPERARTQEARVRSDTVRRWRAARILWQLPSSDLSGHFWTQKEVAALLLSVNSFLSISSSCCWLSSMSKGPTVGTRAASVEDEVVASEKSKPESSSNNAPFPSQTPSWLVVCGLNGHLVILRGWARLLMASFTSASQKLVPRIRKYKKQDEYSGKAHGVAWKTKDGRRNLRLLTATHTPLKRSDPRTHAAPPNLGHPPPANPDHRPLGQSRSLPLQGEAWVCDCVALLQSHPG